MFAECDNFDETPEEAEEREGPTTPMAEVATMIFNRLEGLHPDEKGASESQSPRISITGTHTGRHQQEGVRSCKSRRRVDLGTRKSGPE